MWLLSFAKNRFNCPDIVSHSSWTLLSKSFNTLYDRFHLASHISGNATAAWAMFNKRFNTLYIYIYARLHLALHSCGSGSTASEM